MVVLLQFYLDLLEGELAADGVELPLIFWFKVQTNGSVQTNVQPHMIAIHFVPAAVINFALIQFFTDKIYSLTWCLPAP
jgi:hypothetical protein